jgi:hypothetical protein
MSTTTAGHLEDLIIGLGADDMNSAEVVRRFEQGIIRGTTSAQGHADEYGKAMARAQELTMAVAGPMEKFERQVEELDDLMRLGAISQEVYNKNFDRLQNELVQTEPKVNKLTTALGKMEAMAGLGAKLSFAVTTPLTILGGIALKTASDAEETVNKFNVIFGPVIERANTAVLDLDKNFGLTAGSARQMMSGTGDLLKGFGFSADSALDLSTQVQKLAVDISSFSNVEGGAKRVSEAMTKAMLGEREMLKEMGIAILEEDVKLKVLQLTKEGHVFATERQAKAYATLEIAMEQSAHRLGDFAATEGSFANQTRMLTDEFWELVELFGKEMIPVALYLTKDVLRPMLEYFKELSPETKRWGIYLMGIAAAAGPVIVAVATIAGSINTLIGLGPGLKAMGTNFAGMATGANLARAGVYALGTYLAYEGLKHVLGYNKAIEDLNAATLALDATHNLLVQRRNKTKDKEMEDAKGLSSDKERVAKLKELREAEMRDAQAYGNTMKEMEKLLDGQHHRSKTDGTEYKTVLKQATGDWQMAKERISQIDAELNNIKDNAAKTLSDWEKDKNRGGIDAAVGAAGVMFGDFERLVRGGPNEAEKKIMEQGVEAVGGFLGDMVQNRRGDNKALNWFAGLAERSDKEFGLIAESVIDLKAIVGQTWEIEFKSKGLDKLAADGIDALAMWQEQAYKTAEQVQVAQNAPADAAAGFGVAGGAMVGGGLFGLVGGMTAGAAANTAVPPGQQERDERDRRKEAALAKIAEKPPIVFEVAGAQ